MAKQYMVGTVDDTPLLIVTWHGVKYFVDESKGEVFADEPGLPPVANKEVVKQILELAQSGENS